MLPPKQIGASKTAAALEGDKARPETLVVLTSPYFKDQCPLIFPPNVGCQTFDQRGVTLRADHLGKAKKASKDSSSSGYEKSKRQLDETF